MSGGVKVITPPTLTAVVATADLRAHMRLASDGTEDGLALAYLAAAHKLAEHYAGRPIGSQTRELALDAFPSDGCGSIDLGAAVTSITSLTYLDADGAAQTFSAGSYSLDDYSLRCHLVPGYLVLWPVTRAVPNAVKVRFVCGDVPDAVKTALLLMVCWMYEHRGDESTDHDIQPPAAKAMLDTVKVWGA